MQQRAKLDRIAEVRLAHNPAVSSIVTGVAGAVVLAALTTVGANVYIPLSPVPITLQTLFVLLAGAAIGGRWGSLSQVLYVGLGACGLPLFAGRIGGLAVLTGPTGGYLLSFLVVPFVVAALLRRSQSVYRQITSFAVGTVVIFVFGVAHLSVFWTHNLSEAVRVGVLPFLPGAVLKIAAAVSITRSYRALVRRTG